MAKLNETMIQLFEWYLKADCSHWNTVSTEAEYLSSLGITYAWLPPAYKGSAGIQDTGYGVYDLYDLGEFDQKGDFKTKYGSKEEYLYAIDSLHKQNIKVLADIVFNQKMGADELEDVIAIEYLPSDRNESISEPHLIKCWTSFNFPGRNNKYSDFKWNWTHFHGVDWDENTKKSSVFGFYGKHWDKLVDTENGNFDYLMGCDVDLNNVDVVEELTNWGKWYIKETGVDGFRFDSVKHMRSSFLEEWAQIVDESMPETDVFSVGEYWSDNLDSLKTYLSRVHDCMSLFDVPLHYNFYKASYSNGEFDMRQIFDNTLVSQIPDKAVTFVDNHDTEPGQALESWVDDWFKPIAYSLILLREAGLPCVFYGDLYGIFFKEINPMGDILEKIMKARLHLAYGPQRDYFDDASVIGWTREGDSSHPDSGIAVIATNKDGGNKLMNVGKNLANSIFFDCTGNINEPVYVDNEGNGIFYVNGGSVSIWIKKDNQFIPSPFNSEDESN